ncbi:hypothetical protein M878_28635 [Streptomyces roseochromogenus subsp. oscitans DS 12.976]|uniref:SPFH domain-containing protein n=1 Tax=Streptomyces roseochromogenus subsp. oscitans DS 12.976 TaxID=1352936 RepID=V6K087_STRRC|nr:hypothetical protein M878_28635 [Streptomyces roseochromogenus subsp. oscitans DS 12.976]
MSTTTSHTPPESEGQSEGAAGPGGRPARLIQNEMTTEIPAHLLFRDDPDPVTVSLKPAVVSRRQGTGEQSRLRRQAPVRRRPLPEVDPELVERPALVLPGAAGVLAGVCGTTGCLAASWWAGLLPPGVVEALGLPASMGAGSARRSGPRTPEPGPSGCSGSAGCPGGGPVGRGCSACSAATRGRSGGPGCSG